MKALFGVFAFALIGQGLCQNGGINLALVKQEECVGFLCKNGRCIAASEVCNGVNNCYDGSDEPGTGFEGECPECREDQYSCNNGVCISPYNTCDGVDNCGDASDEFESPELCPPCRNNEFRCDSGRCIFDHEVCNERNDCGDGSDEKQNCPPCSDGKFQCIIGGCVEDSKRCNGFKECEDYSDESKEECPCSDNEVRCSDPVGPPGTVPPGACIPVEYICDPDNIWDCPTGEDESNCTSAAGERSLDR